MHVDCMLIAHDLRELWAMRANLVEEDVRDGQYHKEHHGEEDDESDQRPGVKHACGSEEGCVVGYVEVLKRVSGRRWFGRICEGRKNGCEGGVEEDDWGE